MSKKSRPKRIILGLGITLVLLGVTVASLPLYCSSAGFRSLVLARINRSHTSTANCTQLSVGWQTGITISDFSLHEEDGTAFRCKSIISKPELLPLLRGHLRLGQTTIQEPSLTVDLHHLPVRSPSTTGPPTPVQSPSSGLTLSGDITINKGRIQLTDPNGNTTTLTDLNARVSLKAPGSVSQYQLSTTLRSGQETPANIRATGQLMASPAAGWSLKNTNGTIELDIDNLDLEGLAPILALAQITLKTQGLMSATIKADMQDGRLKNVAGQLRAKNLVVTAPPLGTDRIAAHELTVNTRLSLDHVGLTLHHLKLASDLISVNASGRIPGTLASPKGYQIDGAFTCDLAELLAQMPGTFRLKPEARITTGKLVGRVQTTDSAGKTAITSQVSLSDLAGTLNSKALQLSQPIELELRLMGNTSHTVLDTLVLSSSFARITARGDLKKIHFTEQANLARVQSELGQFFDTGPYQIAGELTSDGQISIADTITVMGSAVIKGFHLAHPDKQPIKQERVAFSLASQLSTGQQSVTIRDLQIDTPQVMIHEGTLTQTREEETITIAGHIQGQWDWADVRDVTSAYLPPGLTLSGQRETDLQFRSAYPVTDPNQFSDRLTAQAHLGFDQAHYRGLDFGATQMDIQVQDGILTIAPFTTVVNEGQFHFAGHTDFQHVPSVLETHSPITLAQGIRVNKQCAHQLLMYVNPIFANVLDASGVLDFECEQLTIPLTADTPQAVRVVGTFSVNQLYLEQSQLLSRILTQFGEDLRRQTLTIRPTRFTLENGQLRYDNMQVDVGDNPLNFSGAIGLDKQLHMTVTLPYTLKGRTVKVGRESQASRIQIPLIGTVDQPELDLSGLIQHQFQNLLQDLLK